jgi:ribosome biogenesis GTPase / thiamine phosphate phosphatase
MAGRQITLESLGWNSAFDTSFQPLREKGFEPGRVAVEDKHRYVVITARGELSGQIAGKLLHQAGHQADLPKVGDWVAVAPVPNENKAVIHQVMPRKTKLSRKVPGREMEEQLLVTNIEIAFIVQGLDRPIRPGLLQRLLVMVHESKVQPVVVLNKADLCEDILSKVAAAEHAVGDTPVIAVSARTGQAMDSLTQLIRPGETVVFIGASGVGKSSLINQICGEEIQATAEVRESDAKGRHKTSWRELILMPNGGLVIDTPGMREFQMWLADEGLCEAFPEIEALAVSCRFRNCSHTTEGHCGVLEAVASGQLSKERHQSYLKLKKELDFLERAHVTHAYYERKRQTRVAQRAFNRFKRHTQKTKN